MPSRPVFLSAACVLLSALVLSGCGEDGVRIYRVPKEAPEAASSAPAAAGAPAQPPVPGVDASVTGATDPEGKLSLNWKVPPGWQEQPAAGMRLASFRAPSDGGEADVSVVVLPGPAGGVAANVNRWRGQIGLEPLDEGAIGAQAKRVQTGAGELLLVDFTGKVPGAGPRRPRVLAAILPRSGGTWFFKMAGDERTVSGGKASFMAFIGSLRAQSR